MLRVVIALVGLAAMACGSTVRSPADAPLAQQGSDEAAQLGADGDDRRLIDESAESSGSTAVQKGRGSKASVSDGTGPGVSDPVAIGGDRSASGPITIGIPWSDTAGANAALMAVAGSTVFEGDQRVQAEAVVDHVNAKGGLAGHEIEPFFHQIDVAQYVTKEGRIREGQRMCAAFTEDAEVFAIVSAAVSLPENIMVECAAESRTPLVMSKPDGMAYLSSSRAAEVSGYLYRPSGMTAERRERAVVDGLFAQRALTSQSRVGVLYQDDPFIEEGVQRGLLPALAAHGVEPVAQAAYPDIIESPWQTYVLAFRTANVDFVLWAATTGSALPVLLFMRAADGQGYEPAHGVGTDEAPSALPGLGAPERQLERTHLVGWSPIHDTGDLEPVSENDVRCRDIMRDIGEPEVTNQNGGCEGFFFLAQALQATTVVTARTLGHGVAGLGASFQSVWSPSTRFDGATRDGIVAVRPGRYFQDCQCFR